jgi:MFS superfamily sulfate permease-like transporter
VTSPLFPSLAGYEIDADRELIGLGAANVAAGRRAGRS